MTLRQHTRLAVGRLRLAHRRERFIELVVVPLIQAWRNFLFEYFAQRDPNEKCPRCGHHQGEIHFEKERNLLRHTCRICSAEWYQTPLIETLKSTDQVK